VEKARMRDTEDLDVPHALFVQLAGASFNSERLILNTP
jgi:hypothetical protein